MTIYIASDHGGFKLKQYLSEYLTKEKYRVIDFGPEAFDPTDDYPDYALPVAQAVANDDESLGLLLCRSGQGVCVVANNIPGVRAAIAWNREVARAGRRDDHINVLCLPSDYITEEQVTDIVNAWLHTLPGKEERYIRRLKKIRAIEEHQKKR